VRKFRGNPWAVLLVVALGFFMTLLDLTIVNIAIPNMISRLHASLDDILWVINAYALVLAVLLITAGRLGDILGQRAMFIGGVALFTAASVACGLSPGAGWLIGFRAVQGLGAAILMPQTLTILTGVFPPERRGAAFGVWGAVAGVATIAGPTLGGLLVTAFDWRYIFFINLPIGIIVIALAFILIPEMASRRSHKFDISGIILVSASLLAICYGLVEGQRYNWGKVTSFVTIPMIIGAGVVLFAIFLLDQARRQDREPLVPFALFRDRNFSLMNVVICMVGIGLMGIFLPFNIYLQSVLRFSALKAGLTLAPMSVLSMFAAPVAGRLTDKIGGKYILISGIALFGAGVGWIVLISSTTSVWYDFAAPLLIAGVGVGCVFAPMTTVAMRDVKPQLMGAASGTFNTTRQLGSVIGTASIGALLQNRLTVSLADQARQRAAVLPSAVRAKLIAGVKQSASSGAASSGQATAFRTPAGTPPSLAAEITRIAHEIVGYGFVSAMRSTMILPVALLTASALASLAIRGGLARQQDTKPSPAETATHA